jgi:threonyl-tRNA synthetase
VNDLGIPVMTVKGTNMFNVEEPAVKEHADLFGDRLYFVDTGDKRLILRYAACHQQFAMMRKWNMSYKQLPFGAFEVADAYRLEQSGETMLCFRTRRMNMPDLHVVCKDEEDAREWFARVHERIFSEVEKIGRDYEMLINFSSRKAYDDSREWLLSLLGPRKKKALLHFYPEGINYYRTINIEYHIKDFNNRMREIGTVQMDVGNARRFGIKYVDSEGNERYPIILHTAVIGNWSATYTRYSIPL